MIAAVRNLPTGLRERLLSDRAIGPIGTASRVVGGALFIAVPIALSGINWWDVALAVVALPLATAALGTLITAAYRRSSPASLGRSHQICSGPGCVLACAVIAVGIALTFVIPGDTGIAIWTFLGVSMLVAASAGYAGCEVLAIPNVLRGRNDQIGCILYTPIDAAEARHRAGRLRCLDM